MSIGIKTGMNLSNVYTVDYYPSDYIPGFIFGGYVNYPLTSNLFYSPEMMYSQQGYYIYFDQWFYSTALTRRLNYLNFLPLTAKWYFGDAKLINVHLGPQLGWLFKETSKWESDTESYKEVSEVHPKFDFSAVVGLGADLKSGLNFGCRMSWGFIDLRGEGFNASMSNLVFQAHIGYTFIKH